MQFMQQRQPEHLVEREAIAANVQRLIEQLEQGQSEGLTAYLAAMGRCHRYSFFSILQTKRDRNS